MVEAPTFRSNTFFLTIGTRDWRVLALTQEKRISKVRLSNKPERGLLTGFVMRSDPNVAFGRDF